ncbi:MAG: HAD hydrolase-like protein [Verrucomicrobia bacterium]|nr:HAD hydrolase-like protein [Verrucomicrobiota bacterium]
MVRLVLFDIDGTLIRTGGAGVKAFALTAEHDFGLPDGTQRMSFAGRTDTSLVRELLTAHGRPTDPATIIRFLDAYVFRLDECLRTHEGRVCPGVQEFIGALHRLNPPPLLGLQTGNIRLGAEIKLRHYGLWQHFAVGGFGDDDEDRNRLVAVGRARGERLLGRALAGDEVLVVGDTPADVRCGRAIGAKVLAVATGGASPEALRQSQPDWLVPDLTHAAAGDVCG